MGSAGRLCVRARASARTCKWAHVRVCAFWARHLPFWAHIHSAPPPSPPHTRTTATTTRGLPVSVWTPPHPFPLLPINQGEMRPLTPTPPPIHASSAPGAASPQSPVAGEGRPSTRSLAPLTALSPRYVRASIPRLSWLLCLQHGLTSPVLCSGRVWEVSGGRP